MHPGGRHNEIRTALRTVNKAFNEPQPGLKILQGRQERGEALIKIGSKIPIPPLP